MAASAWWVPRHGTQQPILAARMMPEGPRHTCVCGAKDGTSIGRAAHPDDLRTWARTPLPYSGHPPQWHTAP